MRSAPPYHGNAYPAGQVYSKEQSRRRHRHERADPAAAVQETAQQHGRRAIAAGIEDNGKKADINIEPRFSNSANTARQVCLSEIGRNKLFVVKNICEMQETVEAEGVMKLGKSDEIDFAQETFTEDSEKFYEFISGGDKERRAP